MKTHVVVVEVAGHLIWCCFIEDEQRFDRVAREGSDDTATIGELPYPLGGMRVIAQVARMRL